MQFPTLSQYVEAIVNSEGRFRTLTNVRIRYDNQSMIEYRVSRGSILFSIEHNSQPMTLCCFTSQEAFDRHKCCLESGIKQGEIIENELFVFNNQEIGDYHTVIIASCDQLTNQHSDSSEDPEFSEGMKAEQGENGLWGFRNYNGELTIGYIYSRVNNFEEGRAVVELDGLMGLIDRDGVMIIPAKYDELSWDGSTLVYADLAGRRGCIDRMGRQIVECKYDWIGEFYGTLALVVKHGKHGYVNLNGQEQIPLIYDNATSFNIEGYAHVGINGQEYVIDTQGKKASNG